MSVLKRGMSGEPVRMLQVKLGIKADGSFGPATETALKEAQKQSGLKADGIAGPDSFMALGLPELVLLRLGTQGATVKQLQTALGIEADGRFGAATRKAVVAMQEKLGIKADGMAGPETLSRLESFAPQVTKDVVGRSKLPDAPAPAATPASAPAQTSASAPAPAASPVVASASAAPVAEGEEPQPVEDPPPEDSVWSRVKGWFS